MQAACLIFNLFSMKKRFSSCLAILLLLLIWSMIDLLQLPSYVFPSIAAVARSFAYFFTEMAWYRILSASILRVVQAFLLAAILGCVLGSLCATSNHLYRIVNPLITFIKAIPGIGWLPLSMVWFGISNGKALFLMGQAAFFPIYLSCYQGMRSIPENYHHLAYLMKLKPMEELFQIRFPAAFPQLIVGLRNGLTICWAYLVLAEISGVSTGLGVVMNDGRMLGKSDQIVMAMLLFAILGKLSDLVLLWLAHRYKRGNCL